jgi:hypothetical protein
MNLVPTRERFCVVVVDDFETAALEVGDHHPDIVVGQYRAEPGHARGRGWPPSADAAVTVVSLSASE